MSPETLHDTVAITDLGAYARNIRAIRAHVGAGVNVMAVVKANAYGHGMVPCAKTALDAGAVRIAVAFIAEGVELRRAGVTAPILALAQESFNHLPHAIRRGVTVTLTSFAMLDELKRLLVRSRRTCTVHVKVDTGMGRVGVMPEEAPDLVAAALRVRGIIVEGIFSHFSSAIREDDPFSRQQIERFSAVLDTLDSRGIRPPVVHLCNSAGLLNHPDARFSLVRPGIMTYGLRPFPGSEQKIALEPVLSLVSRIGFLKEVPAGFPVSYGGIYVTRRRSLLATVPVGYSYGFSRHLSNRGTALINGVHVPVAGRVCMDQTVFDVTDAGDVHVGDRIVLIGRDGAERIAMEDHARIAETISYEIATGISGRVSRIFLAAT